MNNPQDNPQNTLGDIELQPIVARVPNDNLQHIARLREQEGLLTKCQRHTTPILIILGGVTLGVVGYAAFKSLTADSDSLNANNDAPNPNIIPIFPTLTTFNEIRAKYQLCEQGTFDRSTHTVKHSDVNINLSELSCSELSRLTGEARECGRKSPDVEPSFQTGFDKHCEGYGNDKVGKRSLATQLSNSLQPNVAIEGYDSQPKNPSERIQRLINAGKSPHR